MAKESKAVLFPEETIMSKIFLIRGRKVMLDRDLAELYGVSTFRLNEHVKRNQKRFPEDFMFKLTKEEKQQLMDNYERLGSLKFSPASPNVFTECGAVMLASVLNSDRAIGVNIQVVRILTKMRELALNYKDVLLKIEQIERKVAGHDENIQMIFSALKQLLNPVQETRKRVGFRRGNEE